MSSLSSKGGLRRDFKLKSIIFCGGEVFLLKNFPCLVNNLLSKKIFISIITNGTIDKLDKIKDPQNCQLLVSLDGPKKIHDQNRGEGSYDKTINFIKHALSLGFPVEIFFLITKDSYPYKDSFNVFDLPKTYLTDRLMSLTPKQVLDIKTNYRTYPAKNFGCFQLAVQSNGLIYGCCESPAPLASLSDPIPKIIKNFLNSLSICQKCPLSSLRVPTNIGTKQSHRDRHGLRPRDDALICNGCCNPNYLCNYKKELHQKSCKDVIKLFNA